MALAKIKNEPQVSEPISEEQEDKIMAKFALKILEEIESGEGKLYPMSTLVEMTNDDYPYDLGRFSKKYCKKQEIINDADLAEKQENATLVREAERVFGRIDSGEEKTISSKNLQQNPWN